MERERLEKLSLKQLQDEAVKYQLHPLADKKKLIDSIIAYLEANSPLIEVANLGTSSQATTSQLQDQSLTLKRVMETMNFCLQ